MQPMKRFFLFLSSSLLVLSVQGQNRLFPYSDGTKWGLVNENLQVLMPPQFDYPFYFNSEFSAAIVKKDRKYGAVNGAGQLTVPCIYEELHEMGKTNAYGRLPGGKYIFLDLKSGKQIRDQQFDDVTHRGYGDFIVVTIDNKEGCYDEITGKPIGKIIYDEVITFPGSRARVKMNGKYGMLDLTTDSLIVPIKYDMIGFLPDQNYKQLIQLEANLGDVTVYMDKNGKVQPRQYQPNVYPAEQNRIGVVTATNYPALYHGQKSLSLYSQGDGTSKVTIVRLVSQDSSEILETHILKGYSKIEELRFYNYDKMPPVIKAVKDGHVGLIDIQGKVVVPFLYDNIKCSPGGQVEIFKDGKMGLLRKDLSVLIAPVLDRILGTSELNAWFVAMPDGKQGFMDKSTGKIFIPGVKD